MARKPVKKRSTRKAKVVKKTTFDRVLKAQFAKKPKVLNPKFKLKVGTKEDPFFIYSETIPQGVSLQWISTAEDARPCISEALDSGWKPVKGQKEVKGQALMWAPTEVAYAQRDDNINRARRQMDEARKLFGMDDGRPSPYHGPFPIVGADFIEAKAYDSVPHDSPPLDIEVSIQFRVSARWQDAAASLGLDIREYVRRRLRMEPVVLGSYEHALSSNHIYEPVQLSITRKD